MVIAFAGHVRQAAGLDATEAMLIQARKLAERSATQNVAWHLGDVYALPFNDSMFDIVSCRFALHHFETPAGAFAEMVRVCRPGGCIVLCDAIASDDARKAEAFNRMERHRDPSTVEFHSLGFLSGLFTEAGLPAAGQRFYQVPVEREALISMSFPAAADRALNGGRHMIFEYNELVRARVPIRPHAVNRDKHERRLLNFSGPNCCSAGARAECSQSQDLVGVLADESGS